MKLAAVLLLSAAFAVPAYAVDPPEVKVTGTFEPADAKPGQTVTLKLKVELDPKWHTYPTVQPVPANSSYVTKILFEDKPPVVFVGKVVNPPNPTVKNDPDGAFVGLHEYEGGAMFEQVAVVPPDAKPGELKTTVKLRMTVCDASNCFPKVTEVKVSLKVSGQPVPVEEKYRAEVKDALAKLKQK